MKMPSRVAQTMPQMNMKNCVVSTFYGTFYFFNRCRRKRSKVDASIFDSALSHTRRSDASEKREENIVVALRSLLNVFACGQVSSPHLYRLRLKSIVKIWSNLFFAEKTDSRYYNSERNADYSHYDVPESTIHPTVLNAWPD